MGRFVILIHERLDGDKPGIHWDLMLEAGDVLRTWRLAAPPQPGTVVAAAATFDHRRRYLDYEGPVSGNRGRVVRWDHGTFSWQKTENDHLAVELNGMRLRGSVALKRAEGGEWALTFGT